MKHDSEGTNPVFSLDLFRLREVSITSRGTRAAGGASRSGSFAFPLLFGEVSTAARDPFVMALHAVEALARLGEHEFNDAFLAASASETLGVKGIIARHDCLIEDRELADFAIVAIRTNR